MIEAETVVDNSRKDGQAWRRTPAVNEGNQFPEVDVAAIVPRCLAPV